MNYRLLLATITIIALTINITQSSEFYKERKRNAGIFHLLLGLYKLKPLQSSKIYKTFSENVLGRGDKITYPNNEDSGENQDQHQTFQPLDFIETATRPTVKRIHNSFIEKPNYNIENVNTENFDIDVVLQNNIADKLQKYADHGHSKETGDSFSNLIRGITGNSINFNNNISAAKSLPVGNSYIFNTMTKSKQNLEDILLGLRKVEENNGYSHKPIAQVLNNIPAAAVPNDDVMNADVIVL